MFGRSLSNVALAQVRDVIRDEVRAELNRIMSPTFMETVTRGQQEMSGIFDAVARFEDELDAVRTSIKILEAAMLKQQEASTGAELAVIKTP